MKIINCPVWNQHPRIFLIAKFCEKKQKCLNLVPKMPYLSIFDQKCYIWVFLGRILTKLLSYLKSSTHKFIYLQNLTKKQKCLNLGPKMPYLGIFYQKCLVWVFLGYNFKRTIAIFEISNPSICLIAKCHELIKCLNLGLKLPYLCIFGLEFSKTILIFEISTLKLVKLPNFVKKQNCLNFGPKVPYLGTFGQEF